MTTTTIPTEISAFAQRVRAALSDLPADEVEDLTEGMEADLAEAYAEDLQRELPDAGEYAAELRAAAGLPVRRVERRGVSGAMASMGEGVRATVADVGVTLRRNPSTREALDFAATLRPAWWLVRAWVAASLVGIVLGTNGLLPGSVIGTLVLVVFVLVSVQWGRGRWGAPRLGALIVVGNVLAALLLLPLLSDAAWSAGDVTSSYDTVPPQGLSQDGETVTNVFAFDADGRPLADVQLFDQQGRPLTVGAELSTCVDAACMEEVVGVPRVTQDGATVSNVFPLRVATARYDDMAGRYEPAPGASPQDATPPFQRAATLVVPDDGDAEVVEPRNR